MAREFQKIAGQRIANRYSITDVIGSGAMGVVYKAVPLNDPLLEVAIKVITSDKQIDSEELLRFQKEASLMSQLMHPNIIYFHELGLLEQESEILNGGCYIVMEIADGLDLKKIINRDKLKDLDFFFDIALQISSALDYTHGKSIIHRDIKPHNIIVSESRDSDLSHMVKILDFGVARRIGELLNSSGSGEEDQTSTELAGTPLYMAPEQSGFFDGDIDQRVDLYSLGCVLYEVLTGMPPFRGSSLIELQRAHAEQQPTSIREFRPNIPEVVEDIVLKLLAKNPTNRYQSAFGLHADLIKVRDNLNNLAKQGKSYELVLGSKDRFKSIPDNDLAIDREEILSSMQSSFQNLAQSGSRTQIISISGEVGVGKTQVLDCFKVYLAESKVKFISCTFNEHDNSLPFNALANAFNEYLTKLLRTRPRDVEDLKYRIENVMGNVSHVIAKIIPGLIPFIESNEADELSERYERDFDFFDENDLKLFKKAFSDFIRCLGKDSTPLVFVFDNLQWADKESLKLISDFISHNNSQKYLIVLSYRSEGIEQNKSLSDFILRFKKLRRRFNEINLDGLSFDGMSKFVTNLFGDIKIEQPFLDHLEKQTSRVPLAIFDVLKNLVASDLIFLNSKGDWEYDAKKIVRTVIKNSNIDLIVEKTKSYSASERHLFQTASVIGTRFLMEVVKTGDKLGIDEIGAIINKGLDDGLIVDSHSSLSIHKYGRCYSFVHKKVRDAIYSSLQSDEQGRMHFEVAQRIEKLFDGNYLNTKYVIANHYNRALSLLTDSIMIKEATKSAFKYNYLSAKKSMADGIFVAAEQYFKSAYKLSKGDLNISEVGRRSILLELSEVYQNLSRYDAARKVLHKLRAEENDSGVYLNITNKLLSLEVFSGSITYSKRLVSETSAKLKLKITPFVQSSRFLKVVCFYVMRISNKYFQNDRYSNALEYGVLREKAGVYENSQKMLAGDFYRLTSNAHILDDSTTHRYFHEKAWSYALKNKVELFVLIDIFLTRIHWLMIHGKRDEAVQLFVITKKRLKPLESSSLIEAISCFKLILIDYPKVNIQDAIGYFKKFLHKSPARPLDTKLNVINEYYAYLNLQYFDFEALRIHVLKLPGQIPTKNWVSSRCFSILLFSYFLQGKCPKIVEVSKRFINKRKSISARQDEAYTYVIKSIMYFSDGEFGKSKKSFIRFVQKIIQESEVDNSFPFEIEFVSCFLVLFPRLYENETGESMDISTKLTLFSKKYSELLKLSITARYLIAALLVKNNQMQCSKLLSACIKASEKTNNKLVKLTAEILESYLPTKKLSQLERKLDNLEAVIESYELLGVVNVLNRNFDQQDKPNTDIWKDLDRIDSISLKMLKLVFIQEKHKKIDGGIAEVFDVLIKAYRINKFALYFFDSKNENLDLFYSEGFNESENKLIVESILPYGDINHPILLPNLLNQQTHNFNALTDTDSEMTSVKETPTSVKEFDFSKTARLDADSDLLTRTIVSKSAPRSTIRSNHNASTRTQNGFNGTLSTSKLGSFNFGKLMGGQTKANDALIPIQGQKGNLGLIFIEKISPINNQNQMDLTEDLTAFGSTLNYLFIQGLESSSAIFDRPLNKSIFYDRKPFKSWIFEFDTSEFLNIHKYGVIFNEQYMRWAKGVNIGKNGYLTCYCDVKGQKADSEFFAAASWYRFNIMRSYLSNDVNVNSIQELIESFVSMLTPFEVLGGIDEMSIVFSYFDKEDGILRIFNFGDKKPVVYGDKKLTQVSDIISRTRSRKALRLYTSQCTLDQLKVYLLYDFSTGVNENTLMTNIGTTYGRIKKSKNSNEFNQVALAKLFSGEKPEFYIAILPKNEGDGIGKPVDDQIAS